MRPIVKIFLWKCAILNAVYVLKERIADIENQRKSEQYKVPGFLCVWLACEL
jgi:hypothetical protein